MNAVNYDSYTRNAHCSYLTEHHVNAIKGIYWFQAITVTARARIALVVQIGAMKRQRYWFNNYSLVLEATKFALISSFIKLWKIREQQLHLECTAGRSKNCS